MGNVSDAKDIKRRMHSKPGEVSGSIAGKIAQIKNPGLLESLKKDVEKHD